MEHKSTKTVGFVARGITKGGVGRFVESILKEFNKNPHYTFYIFTDDESYILTYPNLNIVVIKAWNKLIWDLFKSFRVIKKYPIDFILYPKNIIPFTHYFLPCKKVNVIHDLAYFDKDLREYRYFDTLYFRLFSKISCRIADKVLVVSDSTKQEVKKRLKVPEAKIQTVYESVDDHFRREKDKEKIRKILNNHGVKEPFLFYCGSLSPRKNMLRVLKAFHSIKDEIPHNIYLASSQTWHDKPVFDYIKKHLSDRVFFLGYITEDDLVVFYSSADLYLYPSVYEGFGFPILEAQACGCPVLTSNLTSCPEVAGEGAVIVNPASLDEIEEGILKVLKNPAYKEQLIEKGYRNIKRFSWKTAAEMMLDPFNR